MLLKTENFEGPVGLLLDLIERKKNADKRGVLGGDFRTVS